MLYFCTPSDISPPPAPSHCPWRIWALDAWQWLRYGPAFQRAKINKQAEMCAVTLGSSGGGGHSLLGVSEVSRGEPGELQILWIFPSLVFPTGVPTPPCRKWPPWKNKAILYSEHDTFQWNTTPKFFNLAWFDPFPPISSIFFISPPLLHPTASYTVRPPTRTSCNVYIPPNFL